MAQKIDDAYASALKLLADNQKTLGELLADDAGQQSLNQIYEALNVVHRLHEGELAKALNIQLASMPTTVTDHAATPGNQTR